MTKVKSIFVLAAVALIAPLAFAVLIPVALIIA